jgi:hypothetical protein
MNEIFCGAVRENPRNLYPTDDIGPTNCQPWRIDIDIYVRSKKTVDRCNDGSVSSLELRPIIPMQSVLPRIYEPILPMLQWTLLTVRYPFWVFMHRLWPSSIGIGPVEVGTDDGRLAFPLCNPVNRRIMAFLGEHSSMTRERASSPKVSITLW